VGVYVYVIFLMSHHLSQPYIYLIGRPSQGADINWNARVQVNNKLTHIFPDAQFFTHHAFEHLQKKLPIMLILLSNALA